MQVEELSLGMVVFDTQIGRKVPKHMSYFYVRECHDPELGPWVLEQVASGARRTIHLMQVEGLRAPVEDGLYSELIGQELSLEMKFGSTVTGTLHHVELTEFEMRGNMEPVVVGFVLDAELHPIQQVAKVVVV